LPMLPKMSLLQSRLHQNSNKLLLLMHSEEWDLGGLDLLWKGKVLTHKLRVWWQKCGGSSVLLIRRATQTLHTKPLCVLNVSKSSTFSKGRQNR
jgi:hypothetical protein